MSWIVSKDLDCTSEPNGTDYYQHVKVGKSLKLDLEVIMLRFVQASSL